MDAHTAKFRNSLRTVFLHGVRHSDRAHILSVPGKKQRGLPLFRQSVRRSADLRPHDAVRVCRLIDSGQDKGQVSARHFPSFTDGCQAIAGYCLEIRDGKGPVIRKYFCASCRHSCRMIQNSPGQRMFAAGFQRCRPGQQFLCRNLVRRKNICHDGFPLRDRPRLVQGYDLHVACLLQGFRSLIEDAVFRAHAVADHDRNRRRQPQCTGTAHDKHRDAAGQREAGRPVHDHKPEEDHDQGDPDDRRYEDSRDRVRQPGDGRLCRSRVAHHLDDLGESAVLSDTRRLAAQIAGLVQGRARDLVSLLFIHRNALARERCLIDRARSLEDDTVHRDVLARTHNKNISCPHVIDPDLLLLPVPDDCRSPGRKLHQALQRVRRASLGPGLQHLAHCDQSQYHRSGFEIELHHILRDRSHISIGLRACHREQHHRAVDKGRAGAHGDQRIHVGRAVQQALKPAHEKLLVDHHDDGGQKELDQTHCHMVACKKGRQGKSQHHMPHGKIHEDDEKAQRSQKTFFQDRCLPVLQRILLSRQFRGETS